MKRDIFKKRITFKPYEYPEIIQYMDAIRQAYWLSSEFNYTADIQDFKTNINDSEREIITRAMLAISQIEVTVKRFWADIYNYFPKPEIDMVGVTFADSECVLGDTEILTEQGWIKFEELAKGIKVAAYNKDNKTISFEVPKNYIEKDYSGTFHSYKDNTTDIIVTEKHDMLFYDKKNNTIIKSPGDSLDNNSIKENEYHYPVTGILDKEGEGLSDLEKLKIYLLLVKSDSNGYSFDTFNINPIEDITKILENLGIQYTKSEYIRTVESAEGDIDINKVKIAFDNNFINETLVLKDVVTMDWVDLSTVTTKWCEDFSEAIYNCSLNLHSEEARYFNCSNLTILDKVQAILAISGYKTKVHFQKDTNSKRGLYIYKNHEYNQYPYRSEFTYSDSKKVYCVEVSTGSIVTRRNGKVAIIGNCRHSEAYSNLLELLGLNEMFEHIHEYPALQARVDYVESFMNRKNLNHQGFVLSLTLFSLFIEHISLFSQFYIMMSFNKFKNLFKGISNAVEATSKEEEIHGRFGIALYNIIKEEQPKMFDQEFYKDLVELAEGAFSAEMQIIDWIYESGDLSFASKDVVKNYISSRYNNSMNSLGIDYKFPVDEKMLEETAWFDHEILTSKEIDFFNKRSIDYSKRGKAITADDLF